MNVFLLEIITKWFQQQVDCLFNVLHYCLMFYIKEAGCLVYINQTGHIQQDSTDKIRHQLSGKTHTAVIAETQVGKIL